MRYLMPINSHSISETNEIILLNPRTLGDWYGVRTTLPIFVARTSITGDLNEGWSLQIKDYCGRRVLIDSKQFENPMNDNLDVIQLLGHGVSLMLGHELIFSLNEGYCSATTFIDLEK